MGTYTVAEYMTMHGSTIVSTVNGMTDGALILRMRIDRAHACYGLTPDPIPLPDPLLGTELTEDQKEMVALTALYDLSTVVKAKGGLEGLVQRIDVGSDGSPSVTFFDRMKSYADAETRIGQELTAMHIKLGYVPFLNPKLAVVFDCVKVNSLDPDSNLSLSEYISEIEEDFDGTS